MVENDEPERPQEAEIDVIMLVSNCSFGINPNLEGQAYRKLRDWRKEQEYPAYGCKNYQPVNACIPRCSQKLESSYQNVSKENR